MGRFVDDAFSASLRQISRNTLLHVGKSVLLRNCVARYNWCKILQYSFMAVHTTNWVVLLQP
jgi:uncharacterized protein YraI